MDVTLCVEALTPNPGGIGRYTWELCKRLPQHPSIERLQFHWSGRLIDDPASLFQGDPPPASRMKLVRAWQRWAVRKSIHSTLVHGPNYFLPPGTERGIITVHDLSVFRFPETHPIERVAAFERVFADSLRRAAHVITDSKTVRQELIADFGVSPADVTSVPLGVDSTYAPRTSDECRVPLERWGLSRGKYGLCVSTLEPRKGISRLLRAWRALPPDLRRQYPLVMAGGVGWRNENLLEEVRIAEREGWAQHLGYVEESELPCLFAGARVFAYPSTYEGFGLPPLEAMASGVPVIVSNRSCMPEVSGDAALLIDPDHTVEFSQALQKALIDREWRDEAIARGLSRASDFTWSRCVNETVEVYERLKANG